MSKEDFPIFRAKIQKHNYIVFRDQSGDVRAARYSDLRANKNSIVYTNAVTQEMGTQNLIRDNMGRTDLTYDWVEVESRSDFEAMIDYLRMLPDGKKRLSEPEQRYSAGQNGELGLSK